MTTITIKDLKRATKDVNDIVKAARRRLFELETLQYIREIQDGDFSAYDSMNSFWSGRKRKKALGKVL